MKSIITLPSPSSHGICRENERLKERIKELQGDLSWYKSRNQPSSTTSSLTTNSPEVPSLSSPGYASSNTVHSPPEQTQQKPAESKPAGQIRWEGIEVGTARSPNPSWYGSSSLFYFIGRMNNYLSSTLIETPNTDHMVLHNSTNTLLGVEPSANSSITGNYSDYPRPEDFLTPTQEEYFLEMFWKAYHSSLFPVIDETQFMDHYRALWDESGQSRRPCALVDIVIALCMQHAASTQPALRQSPIVDGDPSIAGRWYFRRAKYISSFQLESPTIFTVQCLLLSAIFLCNGSLQNMSADAGAAAARAAYTLGLHIDPPPSMPAPERQLRRRLWWALYELDSKIGMKLGRPFALQRSLNEPKLPDDSPEAAMQSGSRFAPLGGNKTWLTFHVECVKLFIIAREMYTQFFTQSANVPEGQTIYDDPAVLESQAMVMSSHSQALDRWVEELPPTIKTRRQGGSAPYSIDASILEIEQFAPQWLQRQRINLELIYHTLCINLYRPFICFIPPEMKRRLPRQMALKGALHAITHTKIMHQVLTSTSILTGWHEAFQWQWNASMTFVGFTLACPASALEHDAVGIIDMSIAIFDKFGEAFAVANSAAEILRGIKPKVNLRLQSYAEAQNTFQCEGKGEMQQSHMADAENMDRSTYGAGATTDWIDSVMTEAPLEFDLSDMPSMQEMFQMAYSIEQFTGLGELMPNLGGNMDNNLLFSM